MNVVPWLVAVLILAGCTSIDLGRAYTKRDVGVVQTSWDEWQCRREVEDTVRTPDLLVGGIADAVRLFVETEARDLKLGRCMEARGYTASRPGGWGGVARDVAPKL